MTATGRPRRSWPTSLASTHAPRVPSPCGSLTWAYSTGSRPSPRTATGWPRAPATSPTSTACSMRLPSMGSHDTGDQLMKTTGFVVLQPGEVIFGTGKTTEAAWKDAEEWADGTDGLECWPATAALIAEVKERGGAIAW